VWSYYTEQKIAGFENSDATSQFCHNINNIFDVLNTKNFLGKTQFKRPIYLNNETFLKSFISSSIEYLSNIQTKTFNKQSKTHGFIPIINSGRRTGFNGLIICLTSLGDLIDDVLKTNQLEFLLTYKISQDHLEMFFSAIRSRGGFCDNHTASQFEATYKRLLIYNEIVTSSQANCISQDNRNTVNH